MTELPVYTIPSHQPPPDVVQSTHAALSSHPDHSSGLTHTPTPKDLTYHTNPGNRINSLKLADVIADTQTPTLFALPSTATNTLTPPHPVHPGDGSSSSKPDDDHMVDEDVEDSAPPLRQVLCSPVYLLHLMWGAVLSLRYLSFFGFFNSWLTEVAGSKAEGEDSVQISCHFYGVFLFVWLCSLSTLLPVSLQCLRFLFGQTFFSRPVIFGCCQFVQ